MTQVLLVTGGTQFPEETATLTNLDSTEILDGLTWSLSAPLPSGITGLKAVGITNNIYIFGRIIHRAH